jgi:hypothetical protein
VSLYLASDTNINAFVLYPLPINKNLFTVECLYLYLWFLNSNSIFKITPEKTQVDSQKPTISIKGETTWMFGNHNQLDAFSMERLNLSLTFYYHPKFFEDIGLFIQYYHGSDYYNMCFDHRLNVLRFGLMTEKLRF